MCKYTEWRKYHKVSAQELNHPKACQTVEFKRRAATEINMRVEFSKKYYRNRYDYGHARWMQDLSKHITSRVDLSLDALLALQKMRSNL